jgi:PAS domain S-box-containing protein/diguanylate cyclase (GGDEF)-like protein
VSDAPAPRLASVTDVSDTVLEAAFRHAPVGVGVCDRDGKFLAVNDSLAALLGHRTQAMVGRPFFTFVHPADRAASLSTYFASVVAAASDPPRRTGHAELRCLTAGGAVIWLAVSWIISAPDCDKSQYGIVHLTDVTARREVEKQLAESQQRFELAFKCAPIGIAVVGNAGEFLQVNPALRSMLGYQETDFINRSVAEFVHPDERAASLKVFEGMLTGDLEVHHGVRRFRHREGHTVQTRRVVGAARQRAGQLDAMLMLVEELSPEGHTDVERSNHDPATGLATAKQLGLRLKLTARTPRSIVLVKLEEPANLNMARLDNDCDQLLARLGARIASYCRDSDLAARVGHDAFAILIEDADVRAGATLASRLGAALAEPIGTHPGTSVTARVGVATDPHGARSLESLLREARKWSAPTSAPEPSAITPRHARWLTASTRELALEADLHRALRNRDLELVYQPIIAVADRSLHSVEALSRWTHPALGPIAPSEFIPIAERGPAIHALTRWALETACADFAEWRSVSPNGDRLNVAVNVSPHSFASAQFPELVAECLNKTGLQPRQLVLELTESAAAQPGAGFSGNAAILLEMGVGIAVDDFGAGYSSLARIAGLPITELKLDRALTDTSNDATVIMALLRATVGIANDLGLTLVAEGIETPEQLEMLVQVGCPYAQGYLFAPPKPLAEIAPLLPPP